MQTTKPTDSPEHGDHHGTLGIHRACIIKHELPTSKGMTFFHTPEGSDTARASQGRFSTRRGRPREISGAFQRQSITPDRTAHIQLCPPRSDRMPTCNLQFQWRQRRGSGVAASETRKSESADENERWRFTPMRSSSWARVTSHEVRSAGSSPLIETMLIETMRRTMLIETMRRLAPSASNGRAARCSMVHRRVPAPVDTIDHQVAHGQVGQGVACSSP